MSTLIEPAAPQPPSVPVRAALRLLQAGAIAVVLAASTHRLFDLDRFFVAKELVLHLTALLAGLFAAAAVARRKNPGDRLLSFFLVLSAASALLATNPWAALRALTITASSLAVFWIAGALSETGLSRKLLNGLAVAVVLAAVTSLAQAYGLWIELFSVNRAPGGTLGNRNFVAHAAAFGFPLVLLAALQAKRRIAFLAAAAGLGAVTAVLVLSRSRGAWLAFGAMALVFGISMLLSRALRADRRSWARLLAIVLFIGAGIAAALLLPNTLRWRSENPYLESMRDVANYEEGSGRGRLIQYGRSLVMTAYHPVLGVGPGNWPVRYPEHMARRDPSMNQNEQGMPYNPWPSSDWIAFISERGPVAAIVLAIALLRIALTGFKRLLGAAEVETALGAAALLSTLVAAGVAGMFDAVLLLALPGLIIWAAVGALAAMPAPLPADYVPVPARVSPLRIAGFAAVLMLVAAGVWRSGSQLVAMDLYSRNAGRASLERASALDPGNYRIHLRLARGGSRKQRCEHALAARSLYPNAQAARRLARGCD